MDDLTGKDDPFAHASNQAARAFLLTIVVCPNMRRVVLSPELITFSFLS
jgi:hypothetical protein